MIKADLIKNLSSALGIDAYLAEMLLNRGVTNAEKAKKFLYPSKENFEDPFTLSGMKQAAERIRQAVENGETIVVYGDYDCDGITATATLYGYLSSIGANVYYYIPNRFETGYGLTTETLETIAENYFPDLIVTVDCGISSKEEAEYCEEVLAVDLIVTDHHTLPQELPNVIVVNPKLDPGSPCYDLCGAGVAFKLVQALGGLDAAWKYVELAAVATVADVVPVTGENRLIVSLGLNKINSREPINKGLRILIQSIALRSAVDTHAVGFQIAPRINSLGRLGDASETVRLFVSDEFVEIQGLVEKMNHANEVRKSLVEKTYTEARHMLNEYDLATHKIIMLYNQEWSSGIVGLVAGRMRSEFNRPVILLTGEDELVGSGRAGEGVDMHATIKSAEKFLVKFGGHKGAAGLTVLRENMIDARNAMDDFLDKTYPDSAFSRSNAYEFEIKPEEVTLQLAKDVALLEPFGEGNPKPLFKFSSDNITFMPLSNGESVKGRLNANAEIVGFYKGFLLDAAEIGLPMEFLCECSQNEFKNVVKAQMLIRDTFVVGEPANADSLALFNRYLRSNLYPEEKCDFTVITKQEVKDAFYDDKYCTALLSFSTQSVNEVQETPEVKALCSRIEYAKTFEAPRNETLLAPDADLLGYRKIVLLDTPLTTGYVSRLSKTTGAEIVVVKNNYPYRDLFRAADLSESALNQTHQALRRFVMSGGGASSPIDLAKRLGSGKEAQFLTHFYILFECGAVSVGQGFVLSVRPIDDLYASVLYKRLLALKKTL